MMATNPLLALGKELGLARQRQSQKTGDAEKNDESPKPRMRQFIPGVFAVFGRRKSFTIGRVSKKKVC